MTAKPFYYLTKIPQYQPLMGNVEIKLATSRDQEIVNQWYRCFNEEESSNWEIPQLINNPHLKLYLLYSEQKFIGAAANTLFSNSRFWIGRLWVKPEFRKRGYAENLMAYLENVALSEGKLLSLLVSNQNEKALGLYKKFDYKTVSVNCFWY